MKVTQRIILFLTLITIAQRSKAQTYVLIPDPIFAACLHTIVPTAMNGNSLNITSTLVTTSTHTMSISIQPIYDLTGIQYFSSLNFLECEGTHITSLPPLPNSLTYLNCGANNLNSLPTLPNSLIYLTCNSNSLTSLPTLPNSLITLNCQDNLLTSLPTLPMLQNLYCDHNNITCFPIFPNSLSNVYFSIDPNPYNCLPNYIAAMSASDLAKPLCAASNSNGCALAGIKELNPNNDEISIYPNPNSGSFKIKIDNEIENGEVVLVNSLGQTVHEQSVKHGENQITTNKISSGLYHYIILQNKLQVGNGKLIIE